jgi:hypothetical protein
MLFLTVWLVMSLSTMKGRHGGLGVRAYTHSEGFGFDCLSDLCVDFSAHRFTA